ncbi:MAG TPA: hypothetical protein EYP77_01180, partial [Anaerolineae bacterium]|nr:hypothetical protein [Anaerolineae bacterium]
MFKQTLETSATPHITVTECLGDLEVRGSEQQRVAIRLRDGAEELALEREGESLTLTARDDCTLICPAGSSLTIHTVRGDLRVRGVRGPVVVGTVFGDTLLRGVGPAELGRIYGDLLARGAVGDLQAQMVAGDARVRQVMGQLRLEQVGSDLKAEGLEGGLVAEQVGADVWLWPPFAPGATYRLGVGNNLVVHLPADVGLRLALRIGGRVHSLFPDLALEEVEGEVRGSLGAGEALLEARVGRDVYLSPLVVKEGPEEIAFDLAPDLEGLGVVIEARVAEAMAEMEARLAESLGRIDDEAIRRRVERATEKARQAAERAAERA